MVYYKYLDTRYYRLYIASCATDIGDIIVPFDNSLCGLIQGSCSCKIQYQSLKLLEWRWKTTNWLVLATHLNRIRGLESTFSTPPPSPLQRLRHSQMTIEAQNASPSKFTNHTLVDSYSLLNCSHFSFNIWINIDHTKIKPLTSSLDW